MNSFRHLVGLLEPKGVSARRMASINTGQHDTDENNHPRL
jgi:hypothetical protein